MSETTLNDHRDQLLESLDFAYLIQEGLKQIQSFGEDTWTDQNTHDPGITLMEVLAYAITDLGLKTSLPIEKLLANQWSEDPDELKFIFPGIDKILPNKPSTKNDIRKILISLSDIKNVNVIKSLISEQNIYFDETSKQLSLIPTDNKIRLNGLYAFQLEFEEVNDQNLNSNILESDFSVSVGGNPYDLSLSAVFSYWDEIHSIWFSDINISTIHISSPVGALFSENPIELNRYYTKLSILFDDGTLINDFEVRFVIKPSIPVPDPPPVPVNDFPLNRAVEIELGQLITDLSPGSIMDRFRDNISIIGQILEDVKTRFNMNRSLCEDIANFKAFRIHDIALTANIELAAGADANNVLAEIYYRIDQFFSKDFKQYSLQELRNEEIPYDEIFEGPLLDQGFIKNKDLESSIRGNVLYVSDLVGILMEIEGVEAIYHIAISSYINDIPHVSNEPNCLRIIAESKYNPRLSVDRSAIVFKIENILVQTDEQLVMAQFEILKDQISEPPGGLQGLPVIEDIYRTDLEKYYSIQNDLPLVYGVGEKVIRPGNEEDLGAESNQLCALMSIFDQILANCTSQIANAGKLFSMDPAQRRSYFYQPLYLIPGIRNILLPYFDYLQDNPGKEWNDFVQDANSYITSLEEDTETYEEFLKRRDKFLSHLLARFSRSFTECNLLMYSGLNEHYIEDKIEYIKSITEYSASRGSGFDCSRHPGGGPVWNSDNLSGLQQQVGMLLGLKILNRRDLSLEPDPADYFVFYQRLGVHRFKLKGIDGLRILRSKPFPTLVQARNAAIQVIKAGVHIENYEEHTLNNNRLNIPLKSPKTHQVLADAIIPVTPEDNLDILRNRAISRVVNKLLQVHKDGEGLYLVEHILLRPVSPQFVSNDVLMTTEFTNQNDLTIEDPYSFRISVILPSGYATNFNVKNASLEERIWSARFRDQNFRRLVEKIITLETPAHIIPGIYWVHTNSGSNTSETPSIDNFQEVYQAWLEAKTNSDVSESLYVTEQENLVRVLNKIIETNEI